MMKSVVVVVLTCLLGACNYVEKQKKPQITTPMYSWKQPDIVFSKEEAILEIDEKTRRLKDFMKVNKLEGILITHVRNMYWATAGLVNNQIVLNKDVGAFSLLVTSSGNKYILANNIEGPRLIDEVPKELNIQIKQWIWHDRNPETQIKLLKELVPEGKIGSDIPFPGTELLPDSFKHIRYSFTEGELKRYRWLGKNATEAVAEVCNQIKPGMDEFEIEAMTAMALRARGIVPTVILIGVDDRLTKYRHAIPNGQKLEKYAMVNIVAERQGMAMAVTRFVHFGELPEELKTKLKAAATVSAQFHKASVPGKRTVEIFDECQKWYKDAGFDGQRENHHQGGAIGYDDREYIIHPLISEIIAENQPFAWNPTTGGAKVEETIIAHKDSVEIVTKSEGWPMIKIEIDGKIYPQPDILIRK